MVEVYRNELRRDHDKVVKYTVNYARHPLRKELGEQSNVFVHDRRLTARSELLGPQPVNPLPSADIMAILEKDRIIRLYVRIAILLDVVVALTRENRRNINSFLVIFKPKCAA